MKNLIAKFIGGKASDTIDSIGNVIDKIDQSDEKMQMQLDYKELLVGMGEKLLDYENRLLEHQASIIQTEAKGESWLQRNWRPILMLLCIFIVFSNYVLVPYFGIPSVILDEHIWNLIEVGTGGYIAGRSLEKISDNLSGVLISKDKKRK
jgi:hypothetical protein